MVDPARDPTSEAIAWHLRIADGDEADWEAFTAWLETDERNKRAYDEIELLDAELTALSPPLPANDGQSPMPRRRLFAALAAAAALAATALVAVGLGERDDLYQIATPAGQTRVVALGLGDRIEINGGTRLTLDRNNPRFAELVDGEATFTVAHRPDAPFVVRAGDARIEDLGTVFNVVSGEAGLRVAVAEGSVLYNPQREAVTLRAGQWLDAPAGAQKLIVAPINPDAVGSWRTGRLDYLNAPLSRVAADLARSIGQPVAVDPRLADREFSGTITIDPDRARLFSDLAGLLEIEARRDGEGWRLIDSNGPAR